MNKTTIKLTKLKQSIYTDHVGLKDHWVIHVNNHVSGYRKGLQDCMEWVYTYYTDDNMQLTIDCRG